MKDDRHSLEQSPVSDEAGFSLCAQWGYSSGKPRRVLVQVRPSWLGWQRSCRTYALCRQLSGLGTSTSTLLIMGKGKVISGPMLRGLCVFQVVCIYLQGRWPFFPRVSKTHFITRYDKQKTSLIQSTPHPWLMWNMCQISQESVRQRVISGEHILVNVWEVLTLFWV